MVFTIWSRGKLKFAKVAGSYPVTFLLAKVVQWLPEYNNQ